MNANAISKEPLYRQAKAHLLQRVCAGEWGESEMLPSEWDLAAELGVSQGTARKALAELVADGVLLRLQGKGTFVAPLPGDWGGGAVVMPGVFGGPADVLVREFLGVSRLSAGEEVASALLLRRGAPLFRVRLLWRHQGLPVATDEILLSAERFDDLDARALRARSASLHELLLRRYGVRVHVHAEQFRVEHLPREEAALLSVEPGRAALSVLSLSGPLMGDAVLWRQRYCLTDALAYTVMP
ncbi:GntR family transcriptional regulator [Craterilacuibacter sinensis]|uniref:UTRA domain-containing protein n=1 Tax=Craterilacuibacter sinensis TaxID=2686017 RepID=A0A845BHK4_9NEIS|nr:GntR family transcriptional regulator [Craterilacuibacter sinensis]MXR35679.1 UTRA domain-containing protein [Craterilacuibacter sinensis]RQW29480.1 GntR family transcriptional regulator [Rhodobacteraceae bacterium CH30]